MVVTCLSSYIWFIVWFCTCFDLYTVFFIWTIIARMFVAVYTRRNFFVSLWIGYYLTPSSMIGLYVASSFLIVVVGMLIALLQEVITLYVCGIWVLSYIQIIDWFLICLDFYVHSYHLNHCSWYVCFFLLELISHYFMCVMISITYPVHWLILYFPSSVYYFFLFDLL